MPFLKLKEAVKDYDVSLITLRRKVREIVKAPEHSDRKWVNPSAEDVERLGVKTATSSGYEIHTDYLGKQYTTREKVWKETSESKQGSGAVEDTQDDTANAALKTVTSDDLLREMLDEKDKQIDRKDKQIQQLQSIIKAQAMKEQITAMLEARKHGLPIPVESEDGKIELQFVPPVQPSDETVEDSQKGKEGSEPQTQSIPNKSKQAKPPTRAKKRGMLTRWFGAKAKQAVAA